MRALLDAVERDGFAWVVPANVNRRAEAVDWRKAARSLALRALVRAIYVRRPSRDGRWLAHLAVVPVDSDQFGDVRPVGSPSWVAMCPLTVGSLNKVLRAAMIAQGTGGACSPQQAGWLMRGYREQAA